MAFEKNSRLTIPLGIFLCLIVTVWSSEAWTHAVLMSSVPEHGAILEEAPPTLEMHFNAVLEPAMTRFLLISPTGTERPLNWVPDSTHSAVIVQLPPLAAGVYAVNYKMLARDGHITEGSVRFTILKR